MKNYCHTWNQHPRIYQNAKFCAKIKILKFGLERPFLSIFRLKFVKANVIFEISTLEFIQIPKIDQNNSGNSNNKKWNQKCFIWVFRPVNLKNNCYLWEISVLEFAEMQKLVQNFGTKNLGPKMPYLAILGCKLEKVLIYLRSIPSNLSNCKVSCNNKNF